MMGEGLRGGPRLLSRSPHMRRAVLRGKKWDFLTVELHLDLGNTKDKKKEYVFLINFPH